MAGAPVAGRRGMDTNESDMGTVISPLSNHNESDDWVGMVGQALVSITLERVTI